MKSITTVVAVSLIAALAWSTWSTSLPTDANSVQDPHALADLQNLPVDQIDDQTFVFTFSRSAEATLRSTHPLKN